jgi:MFS family permease
MLKENNILRNQNFKLLFAGEVISNLGDQFTFIALPWLVLKLSSDPIALGITLALAGVPRAILMLFGGAITDRFSSRLVMQMSNAVRFVVITLLAGIVLTGQIELWMVYLASFLFGAADAFFVPAQTTIITKLAEKEQLQQANTIVQGSAQICVFVGPLLVGVLIGVLEKNNDSLLGIGLALCVDALSFIISLITLWLMRMKNKADLEESKNIIKSIIDGLRYSWHNKVLRYLLIVVSGLNLFLVGPFFISVPIIVKSKLLGAGTYGAIMSMWGIGALIGYILAGALPKPDPKYFAHELFGLTGTLGIFLALMAFADTPFLLCLLTFIMAVISGFESITAVTWIQQKTDEEMMGRIMSILMLSSVGLVPVSQMISGMFIKFSITGLLIGSGIGEVIVTLLAMSVPEVRRMGFIKSFSTINEKQ